MSDYKLHVWSSSVGKVLVKILAFDNPCHGKAMFQVLRPLTQDGDNPFPYRPGQTMSDFTNRLEIQDA